MIASKVLRQLQFETALTDRAICNEVDHTRILVCAHLSTIHKTKHKTLYSIVSYLHKLHHAELLKTICDTELQLSQAAMDPSMTRRHLIVANGRARGIQNAAVDFKLFGRAV